MTWFVCLGNIGVAFVGGSLRFARKVPRVSVAQGRAACSSASARKDVGPVLSTPRGRAGSPPGEIQISPTRKLGRVRRQVRRGCRAREALPRADRLAVSMQSQGENKTTEWADSLVGCSGSPTVTHLRSASGGQLARTPNHPTGRRDESASLFRTIFRPPRAPHRSRQPPRRRQTGLSPTPLLGPAGAAPCRMNRWPNARSRGDPAYQSHSAIMPMTDAGTLAHTTSSVRDARSGRGARGTTHPAPIGAVRASSHPQSAPTQGRPAARRRWRRGPGRQAATASASDAAEPGRCSKRSARGDGAGDHVLAVRPGSEGGRGR